MSGRTPGRGWQAAPGSLCHEGGIADLIRHLNSSKGEPIHKTVIDFGAEDTGRRISVEIACSGTLNTQRASTRRQHDQHPRGGTHEEWPARPDEHRQQVRLGQEAAQGEGRQPRRRGHSRGTDRHRVRQAWRAAVRGSDKDEARQHRTKTSSRRSATISATGSSATERAADIVRKAIQARPPGWRPQGRELTRRRPAQSSSLPGKLADRQLTDPARCELFIVEGTRPRLYWVVAIVDPGDPAHPRQILTSRGRIDRVLQNNEVRRSLPQSGLGSTTTSTSASCDITRSS